MSNVTSILKKRSIPTNDEQNILIDGVSLEYLCSRYSTINVFDMKIEGDDIGHASRLVAVVDVGSFGYSCDESYFAMLEKTETLSEGTKYYLMTWAEFENPDFCHDKTLIGEWLQDFYSHAYNTEEVGYYCIGHTEFPEHIR